QAVEISLDGKNRLRAVTPRRTTREGFSASISRRRYWWQLSASPLLGRLFPGGLHFTMLVMNTSSLESPAWLSIPSSLFPAVPTKGLPDWSSLPPGASPTSMTPDLPDPSPGTALFLLLQRSHFSQALTSFATSPRRNSESMKAVGTICERYMSELGRSRTMTVRTGLKTRERVSITLALLTRVPVVATVVFGFGSDSSLVYVVASGC